MPWVVIKFIDTDEIEVVPSLWYNAENEQCIFPPFQRSLLEKAIKQQISPPDDLDKEEWHQYKAKLISHTTYDNFHMANAKASKACFTSDISGTEEVLPKKRIPRKNIYYSSDDDSGRETPDEPSLTNLPKQPNISSGKLIHYMY